METVLCNMRELSAAIRLVNTTLFNLKVLKNGDREMDAEQYEGIDAVLTLIEAEARASHLYDCKKTLRKRDAKEYDRLEKLSWQFQEERRAAFKKELIDY